MVITSGQLNTSTLVTTGLGKDFEIGLSIHQLIFQPSASELIPIDPEKPEENPDLLINAQKGFDIQDWWTIGVGLRSGVNAAKARRDITFANFNYLNNQFSLPNSETKGIAGVYYANQAYAGKGNHWGAMIGAEVELVKDKLSLMGDYLTGNSSLSNINLALQLSLPKEWQLTVGTQLPGPGSDNSVGGVIQIARK